MISLPTVEPMTLQFGGKKHKGQKKTKAKGKKKSKGKGKGRKSKTTRKKRH